MRRFRNRRWAAGQGRGACFEHYRETGEWPAWSRRGGGPGFGRGASPGWEAAPSEAGADWAENSLAALQREVQTLREQVVALRQQVVGEEGQDKESE